MTKEQILELENPYKTFAEEDTLNQNKDLINSLEKDQKRTLAIKFIKNCPPKELNQLAKRMECIQSPAQEEGFYPIFSGCYNVYRYMLRIQDSENKKPHIMLLELEPGLVEANWKIVQFSIAGKEKELALHLAYLTPHLVETEDKVNKQLALLFTNHDKTVPENVSEMFQLRSSFNKSKSLFFSQQDNMDLIRKHSSFVTKLVQGFEHDIAIEISKSPRALRSVMLKNLESLRPVPIASDSAFTTIYQLAAKYSEQSASSQSAPSAPERKNTTPSLFQNSTQAVSSIISTPPKDTVINKDDPSQSLLSKDSYNKERKYTESEIPLSPNSIGKEKQKEDSCSVQSLAPSPSPSPSFFQPCLPVVTEAAYPPNDVLSKDDPRQNLLNKKPFDKERMSIDLERNPNPNSLKLQEDEADKKSRYKICCGLSF